jgi:hypothetical protein
VDEYIWDEIDYIQDCDVSALTDLRDVLLNSA